MLKPDSTKGMNPVDDPRNTIPDVRDGLTETERVILYVLQQTQAELGERSVPTAMLYGRVVEYVNLSEAELHTYLYRLGIKRHGEV